MLLCKFFLIQICTIGINIVIVRYSSILYKNYCHYSKKIFNIYLFKENKDSLMKDQFIHEHIADLLKNVRTKGLLLLVKPYKNITISFISKELGVSMDDTESLIVSCILDGLIEGRIDQVNKILVMNTKSSEKRYIALDLLTKKIEKLSLSIGF